MDKITFTTEDGENVDFFVLDETRIAGTDYILVTDTLDESEEGEALILKDVSAPEDPEAEYVIVEDDKELAAVAEVFEKMDDDLTLLSDEDS